MTELLREDLCRAESLRAVARATGLEQASLSRFMAGTSLRLDKAEVLAAHFGIACIRTHAKG